MYGSRVSKDLNLPVQPSAGVRTSVPMSSSGLLRYGSAPSTLVGEVCEDFLPAAGAGAGQRAGSPDHAADTVLARFLADHHQQDGRNKPPAPPTRPAAAASHFAEDASMASQQQQLMYQSQHQQQQMAAVGGLYRTVSSAGMEANGGNSLIRQSSSPAGFLNHLNMDNGYGVMLRAGMGAGRFRNGADAAADSPSGGAGGGRLKGQLSFSSRQGSFMSQISEVGSEELSGSSPEAGGIGRGYLPRYPSASGWEDTSLLSPDSLSGMKRPRDASDSAQFAQNGLSPQFSLPKTSSEMAAIEKFLEFQDAVPCKIRAKRGCATHPRSIAERVRRTRISERIRKLQELVPNMEKQTNTADMLDLAVDYIKDLQKQVKVLSDNRANCTCSASKQKQFSS